MIHNKDLSKPFFKRLLVYAFFFALLIIKGGFSIYETETIKKQCTQAEYAYPNIKKTIYSSVIIVGEKIQQECRKRNSYESEIFKSQFYVFLAISFIVIGLLDFMILLYRTNKKTILFRILSVLSSVWLLIITAAYRPWRGYNVDEYLLVGILPVIVVGGVYWILSALEKE